MSKFIRLVLNIKYKKFNYLFTIMLNTKFLNSIIINII